MSRAPWKPWHKVVRICLVARGVAVEKGRLELPM